MTTIEDPHVTAPAASRLFTHLWIAWAVLGVGSALTIIAATEAGWAAPRHVWAWWSLPGIVGGGVLELAALLRPGRGDTLSEHVWKLQGGWRSLIVVTCGWLAWWLATGVAWPSAGIFFLGWVSYHFALEAPEKPS
jgi:hypothetical protein